MYKQLLEIYLTTANEDIKEKANLLIHQFDYGCFDTDFKKEITNFIGEYNNAKLY